jgi:serine/threonine protein phosphatase PrpC
LNKIENKLNLSRGLSNNNRNKEMDLSVTKWLEQIGMSEYKDVFSRFESVNAILELTEEDLQALVPDKKHRKKLSSQIKKLKGEEKKGKKDKSNKKGFSHSPSSSVVSSTTLTQNQTFSKSAPTLPKPEDEQVPETTSALIERCKVKNAVMKELWRRHAQDDVEEFLFTNELVAHCLERIGLFFTNSSSAAGSYRQTAEENTGPATIATVETAAKSTTPRTPETTSPSTVTIPLKTTLNSTTVAPNNNNSDSSVPSLLLPFSAAVSSSSSTVTTSGRNGTPRQDAVTAEKHSPRLPGGQNSSLPSSSTPNNANTTSPPSDNTCKVPSPTTTTELQAVSSKTFATSPSRHNESKCLKQLKRLYSLLDDYSKVLQQLVRADKLSLYLNSPHRRHKLGRLDALVHNEIKLVLEAAGVASSSQDLVDLRHKSVLRISVPEGQMFWAKTFEGDLAVDSNMVPWNRFLPGFLQYVTGKEGASIDLETELLLKRVLDNQGLDCVTPSRFNDFLLTFGPLHQSIQNVKRLFAQKWFHGFLSVEEVIKLLNDQPPGTFLVRFSRTRADSFALEYVESRGKVRTVLVSCNMPEGVKIVEENDVVRTFPSIEHLVLHYQDTLTTPLQSDLLHKSWFMGELSVEEAEELLQGRPSGTFFMHFLDSKLNVFLMCSYVKKPKTVKHYLLQKVHSGYVVSKYKGNNVDEMGANLSTALSLATATAPTTNTTAQQSTVSKDHKDDNSSGSFKPAQDVQFYPSLQEFIKANRHHLRYNYSSDGVPTLRVQRVTLTAEGSFTVSATPTANMTSSLNSAPTSAGGGNSSSGRLPHNGPHLTSPSTAEMPTTSPTNGVPMTVELTGSEVPSEGVRRLYGDIVCAQSVATYPRNSLGCQVICDWFRVRLLPPLNRAIITIADGCNWGMRPREAAQRACHAFVEFLAQPKVQSEIRDTQDCKHFLLRAMAKAHDKILEGKEDPFDAGTTTLLGGMVLKINEPDYDLDEWAFVCVSVGDCKAFVWNHTTQTVVDVTQGNRTPNQEITDCGGRLGPYLRDGLPDLRNLACYFWPCKEGDVILLVTDGVHDNLNPQVLGKLPSDLGLTAPNNEWKNVPLDESNRIKTRFQLDTLAALLNQNKEKTPFFFTHSLIQHCFKTTLKARDFMEKNPAKVEPNNPVEYPGKMDHATCVAFRVGALTPDVSNVVPSSISSAALLGPGAGNAATVVSSNVTTNASTAITPSGRRMEAMPTADSNKKEPRKGIASALRLKPKRDKSHKKNTSDNPASGAASSPATVIGMNSPETAMMPQQHSHTRPAPAPHFDAIVQLFEQKLIELTYFLPKLPVRKYNVNVMRFLSSIADKEEEIRYDQWMSGWTVSTYPRIFGQRMGDPITEHFAAEMTTNRCIVALSCGCNWGERAREASLLANHAFVDHLTMEQFKIQDVHRAAQCCVQGFLRAHKAILESKSGHIWEAETCVLLGGILLRLSNTQSMIQDGAYWYLILVNVGDCKTFVYRHREHRVQDLTPWSDDNGRLGPHLDNGMPDLHNLALYHTRCIDGDIIMLLSSGVHNNLDPEFLGKTPKQVGGTEDTWASVVDPENLKRKYRCSLIEQILGVNATESTTESEHVTPSKCTQSLIQHAIKTTTNVRQYMESNPQASTVPKDYTKYPGKMNHATCLSFRVGRPLSPQSNTPQKLQRAVLLKTVYQPMRVKGRSPIDPVAFVSPNDKYSPRSDPTSSKVDDNNTVISTTLTTNTTNNNNNTNTKK